MASSRKSPGADASADESKVEAVAQELSTLEVKDASQAVSPAPSGDAINQQGEPTTPRAPVQVTGDAPLNVRKVSPSKSPLQPLTIPPTGLPQEGAPESGVLSSRTPAKKSKKSLFSGDTSPSVSAPSPSIKRVVVAFPHDFMNVKALDRKTDKKFALSAKALTGEEDLPFSSTADFSAAKFNLIHPDPNTVNQFEFKESKEKALAQVVSIIAKVVNIFESEGALSTLELVLVTDFNLGFSGTQLSALYSSEEKETEGKVWAGRLAEELEKLGIQITTDRFDKKDPHAKTTLKALLFGGGTGQYEGAIPKGYKHVPGDVVKAKCNFHPGGKQFMVITDLTNYLNVGTPKSGPASARDNTVVSPLPGGTTPPTSARHRRGGSRGGSTPRGGLTPRDGTTPRGEGRGARPRTASEAGTLAGIATALIQESLAKKPGGRATPKLPDLLTPPAQGSGSSASPKLSPSLSPSSPYPSPSPLSVSRGPFAGSSSSSPSEPTSGLGSDSENAGPTSPPLRPAIPAASPTSPRKPGFAFGRRSALEPIPDPAVKPDTVVKTTINVLAPSPIKKRGTS